MDRVNKFSFAVKEVTKQQIRFLLTVLCVSSSFFISQPLLTQAIGVSLTATVTGSSPEEPITTVIIEGFAYPTTNVSIRENGKIIAITPADSQGWFTVTINNINPGIYTFSVHGEDIKGRKGPDINVTVAISKGVTITISGIYLGPTIAITRNNIFLDEITTILGTSVSDSRVNIFIKAENNQQTIFNKQANHNGFYSKSILGSTVGEGRYTTYSRVVASDGTISDPSKTLVFTVSNEANTSTCANSLDSDINCDGEVDLIDFSVLLYWWNQANPSNARADINGNGLVDVVDFSIMLYYWTG
ncbi:MAG: dockerin type I repeat-containing protein [Patescibacteria group bacterium]